MTATAATMREEEEEEGHSQCGISHNFFHPVSLGLHSVSPMRLSFIKGDRDTFSYCVLPFPKKALAPLTLVAFDGLRVLPWLVCARSEIFASLHPSTHILQKRRETLLKSRYIPIFYPPPPPSSSPHSPKSHWWASFSSFIFCFMVVAAARREVRREGRKTRSERWAEGSFTGLAIQYHTHTRIGSSKRDVKNTVV